MWSKKAITGMAFMFPEKHIRYIAVTENEDTETDKCIFNYGKRAATCRIWTF